MRPPLRIKYPDKNRGSMGLLPPKAPANEELEKSIDKKRLQAREETGRVGGQLDRLYF